MSLYIKFNDGRAEFFDSRLMPPPEGAAPISAKDHAALMAAQGSGKVIIADAHGNPMIADQASVSPPVPDVVSRFQARMALRNAGHFDAAEAAIRSSGNDLLIEAWDSAVEFRRMSPSILTLGTALGLSKADIDNLFRAAAQITA
ncbi:hypothetical protein [Paracoccus sp. 22332]|uniref:hypothetical protein n=1 Tax=Paracoccus sp. 22332 TaxID=3453913 RepID=UPI003F84FFF4